MFVLPKLKSQCVKKAIGFAVFGAKLIAFLLLPKTAD